MIHRLARLHDNSAILSRLLHDRSCSPDFTVIDVGAAANPWTADVASATFDMNPGGAAALRFKGNVNRVEDWRPLLDHVDKWGKFSYSVCTHTLEDVAYPVVALEMLPRISYAGFISMPSHLRELTSNVEGPWRGYVHHRWIYRVINEVLTLIPKIPLIERVPGPSSVRDEDTELQIEWDDSIAYRILNDDYLGPSIDAVVAMYHEVLA